MSCIVWRSTASCISDGEVPLGKSSVRSSRRSFRLCVIEESGFFASGVGIEMVNSGRDAQREEDDA